MYAETDFLLALVKDEDWLGERATAVYRDHGEELWTSRLTLVELLLVADREGLDAERVVADAGELLEVRGDDDAVLAAATYVEDHGFSPFDALHLVESGEDRVVSSDSAYEGFSEQVDLRDPEG